MHPISPQNPDFLKSNGTERTHCQLEEGSLRSRNVKVTSSFIEVLGQRRVLSLSESIVDRSAAPRSRRGRPPA